MERVDSIRQVTDRARALAGRKLGNLYWMPAELDRAIALGRLYSLPAQGGLALALNEENRAQFCFQTDRAGEASFTCDFTGAGRCVSELIFPAGSPEKVESERRILARLGFERHDAVRMMAAPAARVARGCAAPDDCAAVPAGPEDAAAIERLYRQAFDLATDNPPVGDSLACDIAQGRVRLLRASDGRILGCATCDARGRIAWLRHVAVDAGARGRGLGKRLVRQIAESLPGDMPVQLWVKGDNAPAIGLYRGAGFEDGRLGMEIWTRP